MALIKCSECGNDLSTKAAACPHCGTKVPRRKLSAKQILFGFAAVVVVACIALAIFDSVNGRSVTYYVDGSGSDVFVSWNDSFGRYQHDQVTLPWQKSVHTWRGVRLSLALIDPVSKGYTLRVVVDGQEFQDEYPFVGDSGWDISGRCP